MRHWSLDFSFITGMMVGIEFPTPGALFDEDDQEEMIIHFSVVLDLFIFRLVFISYSEYE